MSSFHGVTSTDTVFIRGFTARHRVEDIRAFFIRESGRNSVEFCRETNDGYLLLALKFETRSIAKEVLSRFDNTEVLGERLRISWYRDMRKSYNNYNEQGNFRRGSTNQQWGTERTYEYRDVRGNGPPYRGRGGSGPYSNGSRNWHPRGGPGGGSKEYGGERQQRRRVAARSTSRSHSRSASANSGSRSRTRSSSNDGRVSRSKSSGSRDRSRKHRSSSDGSHRRAKKSDKGDTKAASSSDSSHSDDDTSPPPQSHKKDKKKKKKMRPSGKTSPSTERSPKNKKVTEDSDKSSVDGDVPANLLDEPPESGDDSVKSAVRSSLRSAVLAAPSSRKSGSVRARTDSEPSEVPADDDDDQLRAAIPSMSTDHTLLKQTLPQWKKLREENQSEDIFLEKDFAQHEKIRMVMPLQRQPNDDVLGSDSANNSPSAVENEQLMDDHRFKMPNAIPPSVTSGKKRKSSDDPKSQTEASNGLGMDDLSKRLRNTPTEVLSGVKSAEFSSSSTSGSSSKKQPAAEGGQWRLPPEKMALVHEKKAEIEKAYKQDCETFATVTKMLISKDPGIEDRIQMSLRENLKEIGQRCIQELRDYIEKLRTDQSEGSK